MSPTEPGTTTRSSTAERPTATEPCDGCPWRTANHGKHHPGGFFLFKNLRRLWSEIRKGDGVQSCHPTDPSHPDHVEHGGAKPGAHAQECSGSVILVAREIAQLNKLVGAMGPEDGPKFYLSSNGLHRGLTREGIMYYGSRQIGAPIGDRVFPTISEKLFESDEIGRALTTRDGREPPRGTIEDFGTEG